LDDDSSGDSAMQRDSSPTDSSLFTTVKRHDSAWSILAAIHVTCPEPVDGNSAAASDTVSCPDLVVVDDPLCIINEYIRYLEGDEASPPPGERKRRRVHVHEKVSGKRACRIRIVTTGNERDGSNGDSSPEEREKREQLLQERLVQEQQELLQLLEQKLVKLQQSQEHASSSSSSSSSSDDGSSATPSSSSPPSDSSSSSPTIAENPDN